MVALTFDDGPYGTSTAEILDILKREKVSATFFLLGMNATRFPEQARRIAEEGHAIGNHSFAHSDRLAKASADAFLADVDAAEDAIASSTGVRPSLYRPPYGSISPVMREVLRRNGYRNVLWNVDPRDWDEASTAEEIVERVLADAKPNAIILLHDGRDTHVNFSRANLVRALPKVIAGLRARGYRLVTIEALR